MANDQTITYTCDICGYVNVWTRDQIMQRGKKEIYRGGELEEYTLACKNPNLRPECSGRHKVGVPRKA
jgi:hypothetical protein